MVIEQCLAPCNQQLMYSLTYPTLILRCYRCCNIQQVT